LESSNEEIPGHVSAILYFTFKGEVQFYCGHHLKV